MPWPGLSSRKRRFESGRDCHSFSLVRGFARFPLFIDDLVVFASAPGLKGQTGWLVVGLAGDARPRRHFRGRSTPRGRRRPIAPDWGASRARHGPSRFSPSVSYSPVRCHFDHQPIAGLCGAASLPMCAARMPPTGGVGYGPMTRTHPSEEKSEPMTLIRGGPLPRLPRLAHRGHRRRARGSAPSGL